MSDVLLWVIAMGPLLLAFGGALFFLVRDRADDEPVAHMESRHRRTKDDG
jgi:hypothetical protein